MSRDKHRSRDRRIALLQRAIQSRVHGDHAPARVLHCRGGMALRNADLQRLVREGMVRITRHSWGGEYGKAYAPKRFRMLKAQPFGDCFGRVNITRAVITPKGLAWLNAQAREG